VDGFGEMRSLLRERFGEQLRMPLIAERGWFGRRLSSAGAQAFAGLAGGNGVAEDLLSAAEARAVWARYGL
jgi:serine protease SohB